VGFFLLFLLRNDKLPWRGWTAADLRGWTAAETAVQALFRRLRDYPRAVLRGWLSASRQFFRFPAQWRWQWETAADERELPFATAKWPFAATACSSQHGRLARPRCRV